MPSLTNEICFIGFLTLVIGVILKKIYLILPLTNKTKKKYRIEEVLFFMIGAIAHILCEYYGFNKWYCSNGYACTN